MAGVMDGAAGRLHHATQRQVLEHPAEAARWVALDVREVDEERGILDASAHHPIGDVLEWVRVPVKVVFVQPARREDREANRFGGVAAFRGVARGPVEVHDEGPAAAVLDGLHNPAHEHRVQGRIADVATQVHLDGDTLTPDPVADVQAVHDPVQLEGQCLVGVQTSLARGSVIHDA